MLLLIKSLALGIVIGIVFRLFKLPVPAPSTWAGAFGVFGVTVGLYIFKLIQRFFQ